MKKIITLLALTFCLNINAQVGIISTVCGTGLGAGTFTCCYSGDGGQATAAELNAPTVTVIDPFGNLCIADQGNHRVRRINSSGIIQTIAGTGAYGYSGDGGQATAAKLGSPDALVYDASGNLYIADYSDNVVRKVSTAGIISTVAGNYGYGSGYSGDGGQATTATLYNPGGLTFDISGNLYIADYSNNAIRMVNTLGIISTFAGNGTGGYGGDGTPATTAQLYQPSGIAFDAVGNLYIADARNNAIRIVNTAGIINTFAGNGILGYSGDGGQASAANLCYAFDVKFDVSGNLYIADYCNSVIRMVNTVGIITTVVGNGAYGYSGDGGQATDAEIERATGLTFDGLGNLYIVDEDNNRVRMVSDIAAAGISQISALNSNISIYPNPSNGIIQVAVNNLQVTELKVYDVTGKLVLSQPTPTPSKEGNSITVDLSSLPSGIYNISIASNAGVVNKRVVISH